MSELFNHNRRVLGRDLGIFLLKVWLDGLKDLVVAFAAVGAAAVDFVAGHSHRPSLFYAVLRLSERVDLWLNLNGAAEAGENEDGLFGASRAGTPTLLGRLEQMVRGGDVPRGARGPQPTPERRAA